jgi:hypothetical protein
MKSKLSSASIVLLLLVFAFGCTPADVKWIGKPAPDERAKMGLKGSVKMVTTSYFRAEDTTVTLDSLLKTEPYSVYQDHFTATGQRLESKDWSRGTLSMHEVHHLNDQGQTTEIEYKGATGERINHASMAYFPNGLLSQEQYFDENGNLYRQEIYSYDDLNRLSEIETKNFERGANEQPITELMKMEYEDTSTFSNGGRKQEKNKRFLFRTMKRVWCIPPRCTPRATSPSSSMMPQEMGSKRRISTNMANEHLLFSRTLMQRVTGYASVISVRRTRWNSGRLGVMTA